MYNALLMQVLECFEQVSHDIHRILLMIESLRLDPFEQFTTLQVFKHQVNVFVALIDLVKFDDVFMIYVSQNVNFQKNRALLLIILFIYY